ncbi:DUF2461 domain-containing protein [Flagellimonas meridianipacifica]|uniref:Uncharacterized protein (TIGR02453 family) n=1 Tax=Flagellimonas meridianipacifica TaxID=1080225 RepID=A0A2T0MBI4_9FLAO|nr:DUF2461 domain-containing protein [Allomuricauda pacifica]PRX54860.1 uncharacterized protein (TIGR02453 family) [Allomuricauda pacifica]
MEDKKYIYSFLRDLKNNNSKEWMDANKGRYQKAKNLWLKEIELILERLSKHNSFFSQFQPKQTIMRINNNRMFHPDKPVYKDYFACSPNVKTNPIAHIHITAGLSWSFLEGGLWAPEKPVLNQVREAIDYDGEVLNDIINDKKFQKMFGGLAKDSKKLKSAPKGYSKEHEHIDLLQYNNITAQVELTEEMVVSNHFVDFVEEAYLTLKPLNDYLEKAISVP